MNDIANDRRVVVLVDMDCFYCQVEVQHDRSLVGQPVAVVQYNSWKGGGIIAVNYEARAKGVGRHMRGDEAVQKCPDLKLVRVKELHGKADLSKYRTASQKVFEVLSEFSACVQRASIDEAYVDLTSVVTDYISSNNNTITENELPNTFIEGYSDQKSTNDKIESTKSWLHDVYNNDLQDDMLLRLTIGAMMVEKLRETIFKKTGFRCSAGISNNKILAKLACGLHKPNKQTLLPPSSVPHLFEKIPVKKVRNLGGKLGNRVKQEFNCEFMSDLAAIPLNVLQQKFDSKTSNFLYQVSRGVDNEPVESRLISKSIGSCKSFPLGLKIKEEVRHWLSTLMNDIVEKLEADYETNKRKATLMTVSVRYANKETNLPISQCGEVTTYNINKLLDNAYSILCNMTENQKSSNWKNPLLFLGVAIGKFVEIKTKSSIDNYFNKRVAKEEKDLKIQPSGLENETSCSNVNSASENDTTPFKSINTNEQEFDSKTSAIPSNQLLLSSNTDTKTNEPNTSGTNNIKTMFAQMKNSNNNSSIDCIAPIVSVNTKLEKRKTKQNKLDKNSFFSKKLEIVSPTKKQDNEQSTTDVVVDLPCSDSPMANSLAKTLANSPLKSLETNEPEETNQSPDGFFSRKLDIVSPSKRQTNRESESIIQPFVSETSVDNCPLVLLCERCDKMIDIDQYDEHMNYHAAVDLSKSLNEADVMHTITNETKKNESTKTIKRGKRKHDSKSTSDSKKSCTSILSYFRPV